MATKIHPAVDGGVKPGKTDFVGGTLTCRSLPEPLAQTAGGSILTQHVPLRVHERDPVGNTFKDRIQFLCPHLSRTIPPHVLERDGGLRR